MSSNKKKTPAEELLDSLLSDMGSSPSSESSDGILSDDVLEASIHLEEDDSESLQGLVSFDSTSGDYSEKFDAAEKTKMVAEEFSDRTVNEYDLTRPKDFKLPQEATEVHFQQAMNQFENNIREEMDQKSINSLFESSQVAPPVSLFSTPPSTAESAAPTAEAFDLSDKTQALVFDPIVEASPPAALPDPSEVRLDLDLEPPSAVLYDHKPPESIHLEEESNADSEKTVAVTGFKIVKNEDAYDKVKVSVGQPSRSTGFSSWGGSLDSNLNQADNLRIAQEKIIELENENERLRRQNEELIGASEIIKERSDLLTSQLTEFRNDRDGLEQSFKNEMTLLKNHLTRKDIELQKAQFKVDELDSRLKFDMKKIRVRERELENRLELIRAEKNAIVKNKDEQILDLKRKLDILQMEVDSYRQKCVELNKQIENSQDSFKRTTRALRLAMANLELQEENKAQLKKAD